MKRVVPVVDYGELARFVITGAVATLGNMAVVWLVRGLATYKVALAAGLVTGMIISFTLAKLFAFRSRSLKGIGGETSRFLIVYGLGVILYWIVAMGTHLILLKIGLAPALSDLSGVFCGGAIMAFTGYFGHRYYTYRTHQQTVR